MIVTHCLLAALGAEADISEFLQWTLSTESSDGGYTGLVEGGSVQPVGCLPPVGETLMVCTGSGRASLRFTSLGRPPFRSVGSLAERFPDLLFEFSYHALDKGYAGQVLYERGDVVAHYLPENELDRGEFVKTLFEEATR
jgi:hypothetical protein